MNKFKARTLFSAMAVIFILTACSPAQPQVPTQDADEVANQVATSVALTVAAQNTQTEAARPTDTPPSTATEVTEVVAPTLVALPTATPFVVVPSTTVSGGGGGGTTTQKEYACDIIRRRPFDNTFFQPGDTFDIKWTIVNTGTRNIRAGTDLKFAIGTQMTGVTRVELPEMKPGDQYEVIFDATAPSTEGHHVMTWVVEGPMCYPYASIIVEK
jgi:hypothetical protein